MSIASGSIDLKSLRIAGNGATDYITEISSEGIFISPANQNPNTSSPGNSTKITGEGMEIFKDGISVAKFGAEVRIGKDGGSDNTGTIFLKNNSFIIANDVGANIFKCTSGYDTTQQNIIHENITDDNWAYPVDYYTLQNKPTLGTTIRISVAYWDIRTQEHHEEADHTFTAGTSQTITGSGPYRVIYTAEDNSFRFEPIGAYYGGFGEVRYYAYKITPSMFFGTNRSPSDFGNYSVSLGEGLDASRDNQLIIGKYNYGHLNMPFVIGNGEITNESTGAYQTSDALRVDWDGNLTLPTGKFSGVGLSLSIESDYSDSNAIEVLNDTQQNIFAVDWNGNVNIASGAKYKVNGTALQNAVMLITGGNSTNASINANTYGSVTTTATIPSGYIVVGVARITSNHPSALRMTGFDLDLDGKIVVYYHNASSSNFTDIKVATQVACIKQVL